jgi:hypothetical protein
MSQPKAQSTNNAAGLQSYVSLEPLLGSKSKLAFPSRRKDSTLLDEPGYSHLQRLIVKQEEVVSDALGAGTEKYSAHLPLPVLSAAPTIQRASTSRRVLNDTVDDLGESGEGNDEKWNEEEDVDDDYEAENDDLDHGIGNGASRVRGKGKAKRAAKEVKPKAEVDEWTRTKKDNHVSRVSLLYDIPSSSRCSLFSPENRKRWNDGDEKRLTMALTTSKISCQVAKRIKAPLFNALWSIFNSLRIRKHRI